METHRRDPNPAAARNGDDSEEALQEEFRREAAERDAIRGDTATDRTLGGSLRWVTFENAPVHEPDGAGAP